MSAPPVDVDGGVLARWRQDRRCLHIVDGVPCPAPTACPLSDGGMCRWVGVHPPDGYQVGVRVPVRMLPELTVIGSAVVEREPLPVKRADDSTTDHLPHYVIARHHADRLLLCLPDVGFYGGGAVSGEFFQWATEDVTGLLDTDVEVPLLAGKFGVLMRGEMS